MKNSIALVSILAAVCSVSSCIDDGVTCLRASDRNITQERTISGFNQVIFTGTGNVVITQGSDFAFRATGPDNVLDALTTDVFSQQLIIGFNGCFNGDYDLNIDITMPEVVELNMVGGVGSIKSSDTLFCSDLLVKFSGFGSMDLNVVAENIETQASGIGQLRYSGSCKSHRVASSTEVEIRAFDLQVQDYDITILRSANHYVAVENTLKALITGTGNVYYRGDPTVERSGGGSGQVIKAD